MLLDWFKDHGISIEYAEYEGLPERPEYLSDAWAWSLYLGLQTDPMLFQARKFLIYLSPYLPDPPEPVGFL